MLQVWRVMEDICLYVRYPVLVQVSATNSVLKLVFFQRILYPFQSFKRFHSQKS